MVSKKNTYLEAIAHVFSVLEKDFSKLDSSFAGLCARSGLGRQYAKIITVGVKAAIALSLIAAAAFWGPGAVAIQLLGLVGMAFILKGTTFQNNRHQRASVSMGGLLTTTQLGLLHAWGGMLQSGVATSRAFAMAAMPDEMKRTRLVATILFYGAALAVYKYVLPVSPYNVLPLITMTWGTLGDFFPSSMSRHTRMSYMLGTAAMIPYHIMVSHSLGAFGVTAGSVALMYRATRYYDIPIRTESDVKIGALKGHVMWMQSMFNARAIKGLSAEQWAKKNAGQAQG